MKIIAVNGTYRSGKTTTLLTEKALEGAASMGAETEMLLLKNKRIEYCRNCLTCYRDLTSEIAPCVIDDDMDEILETLRDADGIIFSSPIHNGFITGLMTVFFERTVWRVCRSTGEMFGMKGLPESRLTTKPRAIATIVSAGGMPTGLRKLCDQGTAFLKDNGPWYFNGNFIGDLYAGAELKRMPESDEDWHKLYFMRELSRSQLRKAYDLGVKMAIAIREKKLKDFRPAGPVAKIVMGGLLKFWPTYKTADKIDGK
ncbi:MAG: flavodoxin family protein [Deltaproteobacteria bacterium]|nr:flavodoxin family protein [Deltaproteobacteria bacterium]